MNNFWSRPAFAVGARTYTWQEVAVAAILRGEWSAVKEDVRLGLALVRRAEAEEKALSDEQLEAAAQEFRYERDLITAEEMETWLANVGLSIDDWMECIERSLQRQAGAADADEPLAEDAPSDEDIAQCIVAEAVCSGALLRFAQTLAGRAAIDALAAGEKGGVPLELPKEAVERALLSFPEAFARSALADVVEPLPEQLAEMARLELVFEGFSKRLASPSAIRTQIDAHRLDWIRLELRDVSFPDEASSREASLCLREDGESFETVAKQAHVPVREQTVYLEDVDPGARPDLLSARPGDLIGPLALGERFHLLLVQGKRMPSEQEPDVLRRAEQTLLARAVEHETEARVRWHERL